MKKLILVLALALPFSAKAEILFEGYYKILAAGAPAGYFISRYEFDAAKKQFIATTFLKTGPQAGSLTESLKAVAAEDLKPISYQYTTLVGADAKTVDAKFPGGKIIASIKDGKKSETVNKVLPKGTFLSTFLSYLILKSKDGMKEGTKYEYQAVAEEEASISKGSANVKESTDVGGIKAFRIINEFKGSSFSSLVSEKGEILTVNATAQGITEELVAQPSQATQSFAIPSALLKGLFGDVPTGQINPISKKAKGI